MALLHQLLQFDQLIFAYYHGQIGPIVHMYIHMYMYIHTQRERERQPHYAIHT